jgi:hypothetical protein|tara:strand:- start:336 stop:626 length:291 start_codon:yes stop_codon:yes gene_type:complete
MMKLPKAIKRMEEDCLRLNEEEYSLKYGEVALKFYHTIEDYHYRSTHSFGPMEDRYTYVMMSYNENIRGIGWTTYSDDDAEDTEWQFKYEQLKRAQ